MLRFAGLALLTLIAVLASAVPASAQSAPPGEIVISEFRTRGPAGGNDEFVELRNRSAGRVEISGWRLQGCAAGTPGVPSNRVTVNSDVFLQRAAPTCSPTTEPAATPARSSPTPTYGTGFTDFAANSNASGIRITNPADPPGVARDGVGSPTSPCHEGAGLLTPTTNTDSAFERLGGTTDTNNNLADFQGPKPGDPQNSGGNTGGEPPISGLRIHDIQGRQHLSPYRGSFALAVPGVVTARRFNGFYFQDPQPDTDDRTSEGVFVFTGGAPPAAAAVGAAIVVNGRVTEFRAGCTPTCTAPDFPAGNFGAAAFANLSVTEIDRATVAPAGTGEIAPTVVGDGGRVPPTTVIDNDTPDPQVDDPPLVNGNVESKSGAPLDTANQDPTFDPSDDGIDFYESLEGMLTQVNRAVVVAPDEHVQPRRGERELGAARARRRRGARWPAHVSRRHPGALLRQRAAARIPLRRLQPGADHPERPGGPRQRRGGRAGGAGGRPLRRPDRGDRRLLVRQLQVPGTPVPGTRERRPYAGVRAAGGQARPVGRLLQRREPRPGERRCAHPGNRPADHGQPQGAGHPGPRGGPGLRRRGSPRAGRRCDVRRAGGRHRGCRRPGLRVPPDRPGPQPGRRSAEREHPGRIPVPARSCELRGSPRRDCA